jgi:hypothetical protein
MPSQDAGGIPTSPYMLTAAAYRQVPMARAKMVVLSDMWPGTVSGDRHSQSHRQFDVVGKGDR